MHKLLIIDSKLIRHITTSHWTVTTH